MPAGAYSIRPIPGTPAVLLFDYEMTTMRAIVFVRMNTDAPAPAAPLMFTSSAGKGRELANIATEGWSYELSVHPSTRALKGAALAITSSEK